MILFIPSFVMSQQDNWGYSTPLQKRYKVGDIVEIVEPDNPPETRLHKFEVGTKAKIIENGRHDYLIEEVETGRLAIVYQHDVKLVK